MFSGRGKKKIRSCIFKGIVATIHCKLETSLNANDLYRARARYRTCGISNHGLLTSVRTTGVHTFDNYRSFWYLCTFCTFTLSEVYSHFSFPIWEHKREPVNLQFRECSCENELRHSTPPHPLPTTPWVGDAERQGTLEDNPVTQRLQDDINTDAGLLTDAVTGRPWYN